MTAVGTAPELWEQLVRDGGLQPSGWDRDLVGALELRLGGGLGTPFGDLLRVTSVEDLVLAILVELRPFGAMMAGLLELFESHGARHAGAAVAIEFDFGRHGKDDLHFDLREFRDAQHRLQHATSSVRRWDWDDETHWKLLNILSTVPSTESGPSNPAAQAWLDEWEKERWPDRGLVPPETSNRLLAARLVEIWELWHAVVEESRAAVADGSWKQLPRTEEPAPSEKRLVLLEVLENDFFSAALVRAAYTAVEQVNQSGSADAADNLAIALAELIERHPPETAPVQVAVKTLQDILSLPVFKHRYELYGAWVFCQLVAAWPPGAELHVVDGVLRFPFKASVLADLLDTEPPAHIVCELRTPLANPKGTKSRKAAIQPDYSVLIGELPEDLQDGSAADLAVMDIECKQYKSPANKDFAYALDDYARGRPKSSVVLVSHGPLNSKTITNKVAADVRDRTEAIAYMDPMHPSARAQLAGLVLEKVSPYLVEAPAAPMRSLKVTLCWERAPDDLDLHLFLEPGGTHISYEKPGDLNAAPFAKLHEDARSPPGEEVIEVVQCLDRHYVVAVYAYSSDRLLAGSDAHVRIDLGDTVREWTCPSVGAGRWWHVCEFDPPSGTFNDLDTIHAHRPR